MSQAYIYIYIFFFFTYLLLTISQRVTAPCHPSVYFSTHRACDVFNFRFASHGPYFCHMRHKLHNSRCRLILDAAPCDSCPRRCRLLDARVACLPLPPSNLRRPLPSPGSPALPYPRSRARSPTLPRGHATITARRDDAWCVCTHRKRGRKKARRSGLGVDGGGSSQ